MEVDILIIGSGPAGIQASIHAARRKFNVLVTGKVDRSALWNAHVENMFGIPGKTNGWKLLNDGRSQAKSFDVKFIESDVIHIERKDKVFLARVEDNTEIVAKSIILAMGTKRKTLKITNAEKFLGRGLSYCADCDVMFFKNKDVIVVGDESAATSSAVMLRKYTKTTHLVSQKLAVSDDVKRELATLGIIIHEGRKIVIIDGKDKVESVKFDDGTELKTDGIFIELGAKGSMELGTQIDVIPDSDGYIPVDKKMATNVPGVFACGDITGPPLQASKAAGEGCTAGLSASEYIKLLNADKEPQTKSDDVKDNWEKPIDPDTIELIENILKNSKNIAVVGISEKVESSSNRISKYLKAHGYNIIPVNPKYDKVIGLKSYKSIMDIPEQVDVVQIFRKTETVGPIVDDAIKKGAKVIWMQEGIVNEEAAKKARDAGLKVIMDRCMYKEHKRMTDG